MTYIGTDLHWRLSHITLGSFQMTPVVLNDTWIDFRTLHLHSRLTSAHPSTFSYSTNESIYPWFYRNSVDSISYTVVIDKLFIQGTQMYRKQLQMVVTKRKIFLALFCFTLHLHILTIQGKLQNKPDTPLTHLHEFTKKNLFESCYFYIANKLYIV